MVDDFNDACLCSHVHTLLHCCSWWLTSACSASFSMLKKLWMPPIKHIKAFHNFDTQCFYYWICSRFALHVELIMMLFVMWMIWLRPLKLVWSTCRWAIGKEFSLDLDPFLILILTLSVIHAHFVSSGKQQYDRMTLTWSVCSSFFEAKCCSSQSCTGHWVAHCNQCQVQLQKYSWKPCQQ